MDLNVYKLDRGPAGSNCYICSCGQEAFVIDPGCEINHIKGYIEKNRLDIRYILLTHGHNDHIASIDVLKKEYPGAVSYAHEAETGIIGDPVRNGSFLFGLACKFERTDREYADNDGIPFCGSVITVIHTPGHTAGSVSILAGDYAFTGDTLFRHSIGRCDLPGGSGREMLESLRRLMSLRDDIIVMPGHGSETTIGREKRLNPYLTGRSRIND